MSKKLLDLNDSSDEELSELNVNSVFAEKYNNWRRKEEIQKLKDKYGEHHLDVLSDSDKSVDNLSDESADSDDESDQSLDDNQQVFDDNFLKVYSALKSKNPVIYDQNVKFFADTPDESPTDDNSNEDNATDTQHKTLSLKEYHKKLIKERKGVTEEDEQPVDALNGEKPFGYYEELDQIRDEFKTVLNSDETDELVFKTQPISEVKDKTVDFLNGEDVEDNDSDIKYLKNYWKNDKQLEDNEKFLRDFILNKSYVNNKDKEVLRKPVFLDNELNDDRSDGDNEDNGFETLDDPKGSQDTELTVSKYHFEEANAVDIKRYPRNVETIRDTTKEEKRAQKRSETKERKKREKEKELKRLRKLKKQELKERLEKVQQISGNTHLDSDDLVLSQLLDDENDFDSDKYDQKMSDLFGDNYYDTEDLGGSKPKFEFTPGIDDFKCDDEVPEDDDDNVVNESANGQTNHKMSKKLDKKQKRIHKEMKEMGIFEDLIGGDLATRFKYRSVKSNDFGLTDEEIMLSDDKELNKWCSLQKMTQYRDDSEEIYDSKTYSKKAQNLGLKQKILKSYYEKQFKSNANQLSADTIEQLNTNFINYNNKTKNSNKIRKRVHKKPTFTITSMTSQSKSTEQNSDNIEKNDNKLIKKKKFKRNPKGKSNLNETSQSGVSLDRLKAYGLSNRQIKKMNYKTKNN